MVVNKRKKSTKQRGQRTHGWGAGKKHRGKGHRGGHGESNVGKRGGARKSRCLAKGEKPYGQKGLGRGMLKFKTQQNTINIFEINTKLDKWISSGLVLEKKGYFEVDLEKMGYQKLISKGKPICKYDVKVSECSDRAKEKIVAAGGTVRTTEKIKELPKAE